MCPHTLIDRKRKHLVTRFMYSNVFTIQPIPVPNVRHLRVQHTFSTMTSLELSIQQSVEGEFRQHEGMVTVMVKWSTQGFA